MLVFLSEAHPRSRGEHLLKSAQAKIFRGSSPLARGTRPDRVERATARRLIPARAGNIRKKRIMTFSASAHPRSRGEHSFANLRAPFTVGSSPLARGTSNL